jgi:multicomponent Na+:H+ antiporter subunit E
MSAASISHGLYTLGLFSLIWFLLTGDDWKSWLVGLPVVILASWSILRLRSSSERLINLVGLLKFLPYFFWESVLGGIDVASRVLQPKMRIAPGFLKYRIRLTQPSARRLFVNTLSLLPGTLAADLQGESLSIHALDTGAELNDELIRLERMVSDIYGEDL